MSTNIVDSSDPNSNTNLQKNSQKSADPFANNQFADLYAARLEPANRLPDGRLADAYYARTEQAIADALRSAFRNAHHAEFAHQGCKRKWHGESLINRLIDDVILGRDWSKLHRCDQDHLDRGAAQSSDGDGLAARLAHRAKQAKAELRSMLIDASRVLMSLGGGDPFEYTVLARAAERAGFKLARKEWDEALRLERIAKQRRSNGYWGSSHL